MSRIYGGNWAEGTKRKCPICKKVFRCQGDWAYKDGYKQGSKYYCSWSHLRQAQQEHEKKLAKRAHGGGRPSGYKPEIEAEIYRRYKEGQKAAEVAQALGIPSTTIYNRYTKWRKEEHGDGDQQEEHPA